MSHMIFNLDPLQTLHLYRVQWDWLSKRLSSALDIMVYYCLKQIFHQFCDTRNTKLLTIVVGAVLGLKVYFGLLPKILTKDRCLNLKYLYCKVFFKSQLLNNLISVITLSLKGAFFISFLWMSSILVLIGYWEVGPLKEWSVCLLCLRPTSSRFCHAFITHWLAPLSEWLRIVMIQLLEIRRTSSPLRLPINWPNKVF